MACLVHAAHYTDTTGDQYQRYVHRTLILARTLLSCASDWCRNLLLLSLGCWGGGGGGGGWYPITVIYRKYSWSFLDYDITAMPHMAMI